MKKEIKIASNIIDINNKLDFKLAFSRRHSKDEKK